MELAKDPSLLSMEASVDVYFYDELSRHVGRIPLCGSLLGRGEGGSRSKLKEVEEEREDEGEEEVLLMMMVYRC